MILHQGFEDVFCFFYIEDGGIGDKEYSLLALAGVVVLVDVGGEFEGFVGF